jgi:hypothetical protein
MENEVMLDDILVFRVQSGMECYMNYHNTFIVCASLPSMCPPSVHIICCGQEDAEENDLVA